ncbi:MAG: hypothetical protein ACYCSI_01850 [Solirubrobacteraceae bacterium]
MRPVRDAGTLLAPVAVAAVALACCAGLPTLAALFASVTLATALSAGAGLLALVAVASAGVAFLRAHRRSQRLAMVAFLRAHRRSQRLESERSS